jgi:transcriptional regulator with XRE-family HTH domain
MGGVMPEFSNQLRQFRLGANLKQREIASVLGVTPTAVSDYESGKRTPSLEMIVLLANRYKIDLAWLITGKGDMYNSTHAREKPPGAGVLTIPVYADIAAGIGIEAEDIEPTESISIPREVITNIPGPYYCFRVNGVSMEPELHTGDYAIIAGWQYDVDYNGSLCAFRSVAGLLIKRLVYDHRCKRCLLVPVNPTHPIIEYDEHSPDLHMIGRLVAVIRKYT